MNDELKAAHEELSALICENDSERGRYGYPLAMVFYRHYLAQLAERESCPMCGWSPGANAVADEAIKALDIDVKEKS